MQSLLHSPFLQALGYIIINSFWQFAFLWLIYFSVNTIFKLSSHQKYGMGLLLEVIGFTWFLVTLVIYYHESLLLPHYSVNTQTYLPALSTLVGSTVKQRFFRLVLRSEQFFPYLSIAYLVLLCILGARWMYAYNFTQRVRVAGLQEIESIWLVFVQNLTAQMAVKRKVHIYLSELVETPLTIGFFKPIILIPLATINYLALDQMEAVIVHEMAHIKRYDYLFNLLLALIEACLFFNPFMQLIHQQVKKERENCCDDWVLSYKYCASSYARALLKIASNQSQKPLLALNATDDKRLLITRIKRIIEKNERTLFHQKHQLLALLVLTTVLSLLSFLSPAKKAANSLKMELGVNPVFEPMAAKVVNPLFNPVFFLADTAKMVVVSREPEDAKVIKTKTADLCPPNESSSYASSTSKPVPAQMHTAEHDNDEIAEITSVNAPATVSSFVEKTLNFNDNNLKEAYEAPAFRSTIEKEFTKEDSKQAEVIQNQIRAAQKDLVKEKDLLDNREKLNAQLKKALVQMQSLGKQTELNKLQSLIRISIKKIKNERLAGLLPNENVLKLNELELLKDRIEQEIDQVDEPSFFTTRLNSNIDYSLQLPTVVYSSPQQASHNYSYQYSTKPRVSVGLQSLKEGDNISTKKLNIAITNEDEEDSKEVIAPTPPVRPARVRTVYIIKI